MGRINNVTRNLGWGLFNKVVAILMPFVTRTAMIYTLGPLYLGLNGLYTSILQVLSVTELGISTAIVYDMYKPIAEGDTKKVCALLNFYKKCYKIIGIIVFVIGIIVMPFLGHLISGDIPSDINIYLLFLINLVNIVITYELFAYKLSLLAAMQRNDIVSKISSVVIIIQVILQLFALLVLKNYYCFTFILIVVNIINNIAAFYICKKKYPQFVCKGSVSNEEFSHIKTNVTGMLCTKIGMIVLNSADTIIISAFLGLKILGMYQNYYYIINALITGLTIVASSMIASIGNSVATESIEKNYKDFKRLNFIYLWLVSWCSICFLCICKPFMDLWVGTELQFPMEVVALFAIYFFTYKLNDMVAVYIDACGLWKKTKYIPLLASIVNLAINLALVNFIGIYGILISTIIAVLLIYDTLLTKKLFENYFENWGNIEKYFLQQLKFIIFTIIGATLTYISCKFIPYKGFISLIVDSIICLVVPNVLGIIVWHKNEDFIFACKLLKKVL